MIFRHDANDALPLPGLARYDERVYGGMTLEFLSPDEGQHAAGAIEPGSPL